MFCTKCGKELENNAKFCVFCGEKIVGEQQEPVYEDKAASEEEQIKEEQKFLDETHRLMRWEKKAWSIAGNVFLIMGAIFAGLFLLLGIMFAFIEPAAALIFFIYAGIFGGMYIVEGVIGKKAAERIDFYLNSLYNDFETSRARCESVGMIVFGAFCNQIAMVFYIINFTRMKTNKEIIARINARMQQ